MKLNELLKEILDNGYVLTEAVVLENNDIKYGIHPKEEYLSGGYCVYGNVKEDCVYGYTVFYEDGGYADYENTEEGMKVKRMVA